ncbi:hypothetical protein H5410_023301 [Solanum commersonii]|uniref:Plastocyanin-like domain-containing protein n=1 Tax=Solanum commersonii TaxID=4109 RepID=A0A9J5ZJE5_SOLCO|nr:hypothetical protein H5410_023301 [Solanum commersonii]
MLDTYYYFNGVINMIVIAIKCNQYDSDSNKLTCYLNITNLLCKTNKKNDIPKIDHESQHYHCSWHFHCHHFTQAFPFSKPHAYISIILGEWWKKDVKEVFLEYINSGGEIKSDAFTINGQLDDFYPYSNNGTFRIVVDTGKKYLLRIVNDAIHTLLWDRKAQLNCNCDGWKSYNKTIYNRLRQIECKTLD